MIESRISLSDLLHVSLALKTLKKVLETILGLEEIAGIHHFPIIITLKTILYFDKLVLGYYCLNPFPNKPLFLTFLLSFENCDKKRNY